MAQKSGTVKTNQNIKFTLRDTKETKHFVPLTRITKQLFEGKYRKGFVLTFVTQLIVLIFGLLMLKAAAYFLGPVGFGEYYVARRAYSILNFSLLLGLGISLPRYIAHTGIPGEENSEQYTIFLSGLILGTTVLILFSIFAVIFRQEFVRLFYGNVENDHMAISIIMATIGIYYYSLLYAYFRAHLKMLQANLLQILFIALLPLFTIIVSKGSPDRSIGLAGILWFVFSLVVISFLLRNMNAKQIDFSKLKYYTQELVSYGIGRVPGEFAYFGFFCYSNFYCV